MNHLIKLRGERDVIRLRNPTEDKRVFRRMLTFADRTETACWCAFEGHKYGLRRAAQKSVFEFSYANV